MTLRSTISTDWRLWGCLLLVALLALPLGGCTRDGLAQENGDSDKAEDGEDKKKKKKELVPVEVASLEYGPIEAVLRFSTNLEAESEVQVFSQSARRVTELLVEEGAQVKKGDVLLRLQDAEQRSNLARVESQVTRSRQEHARQKNLFERELIPERTFNDAAYELEQLELTYEDAQRELSYTEVRAPISGIVTQRMVNLGDHITMNQHLFDMVDFDTIVARVYVPEKERERLATGQSSRLFSE
jgi:membrane fusion protein (multidrug efflux system)